MTLALLLVASPPATGGEATTPGHFSLVLDTPSTLAEPAVTARRDSYVVLQVWEAARARELERANPALEVLAYQNLAAVAQTDGPHRLSSSGVPPGSASLHPRWLLRNAVGEPATERRYPWLTLADVGNPAYQRAWTQTVLWRLRHGPWDGVLIDEANTTPRFDLRPGERLARYPTDASYQRAVGAMLAYAGTRIEAAGKLAIANIGSWNEYPETAASWLGSLSGAMNEMFVKSTGSSGAGYVGQRTWEAEIRAAQLAQSLGKRFLAVTQAAPGDIQAVRFGWASMLLACDADCAYLAGEHYDGEQWSREYEIQLGAPTSSATGAADGLWQRSFATGLVIVNPTDEALAANWHGPYEAPGLAAGETALLAPHSALILTAADAQTR
jgi:hypothetical protein